MGGGPARELLLCVLSNPEPKELLSQFRKEFPQLDIVYLQISARPGSALAASAVPEHLWKDATILFTLFIFPPSVAAVPRLNLVHLLSAGSNQIQNSPIYTDSAVPITTSSGIHGPQIAEWVLMTSLVASHSYNTLHDLQKQHKWGKQSSGSPNGGSSDFTRVRDNVGRRIGILGYGSIGRQVARLAHALGMTVLAYTASPKDSPASRRDHGFVVPGTGDPDGSFPKEWYSGLDRASLHEFLSQSLDWLVVAVPLTNDTRHFLSSEEFSVLSADGTRPVYITNIARGAIIDQPALVEALRDGRVAGAALDVTDPEPLPADSPLWDMPNVIVTPHISASSLAYVDRTFELLRQNLHRREDGKALFNVVKRERGY